MSVRPSSTPVKEYYEVSREDFDKFINDEYDLEIKELKAEIDALTKARNNLIVTNRKLSREISELRWALKEARATIYKLEDNKIEVEYIVV